MKAFLLVLLIATAVSARLLPRAFCHRECIQAIIGETVPDPIPRATLAACQHPKHHLTGKHCVRLLVHACRHGGSDCVIPPTTTTTLCIQGPPDDYYKCCCTHPNDGGNLADCTLPTQAYCGLTTTTTSTTPPTTFVPCYAVPRDEYLACCCAHPAQNGDCMLPTEVYCGSPTGAFN